MKAELLIKNRRIISDTCFVEIVVWKLPKGRVVDGSQHCFKYRIAFIKEGECVLRYDNEAGKGDHKHVGNKEWPIDFSSPAQLITDFWADVDKCNEEH